MKAKTLIELKKEMEIFEGNTKSFYVFSYDINKLKISNTIAQTLLKILKEMNNDRCKL